jgi:hypothetical protein
VNSKLNLRLRTTIGEENCKYQLQIRIYSRFKSESTHTYQNNFYVFEIFFASRKSDPTHVMPLLKYGPMTYSITNDASSLILQRIPDEFITRFGNELKNVATIIVPDGCVWEMELKKCDEHVFFCNRWQEFVEYYSIGYGSYLSFKYEGNSKFSVIIFDATSVEICYPFKTPSPNEEPNTKYHSPRKRSKVETSESCGKKAKSMSKDASKRAKDAANAFNPNNPYFRSKMPKDASKKYAVRILLLS